MKKIKKVGEGAYFVPSYSIPNVQSRIPGMMNYGIASSRTAEEDTSPSEDADVLTQEGFEEAPKKVSPPNKHDEGKTQT